MRFSANLGYLWRDRPLAERVALAAAAGFELVELHDDWRGGDALADALTAHGIGVAAINTAHHGDAFGVAADPRRAPDARADIDAAAETARRLGAGALHVLAGRHSGKAARDAYEATLGHALDVWSGTVLIEPISPAAVPGYHLPTLDSALETVARVRNARLAILFDFFHVAMTEPDPDAAFVRAAPHVGHIQIAAIPNRTEPDRGDIDVLAFLGRAVRAGYGGDVGVECRAEGASPRLDWLPGWRSSLAPSRG